MALEGISRRTFVEGATVAAAFAGTMASVQAPDQALAEEATETLSCDVAVVGLGLLIFVDVIPIAIVGVVLWLSQSTRRTISREPRTPTPRVHG